MKVYGIIGWQNAGKTTLVERLVAAAVARGLRVSTIKHTHHDVDPDPPGSDSHRHRMAGASEVVLAGPARFVLLHEHLAPEPSLETILARLEPVDLVLVEGYKRAPHRKIEVWRAGQPERAPIPPGDPMVRALASDMPLPGFTVPILDLNQPEKVLDFILQDAGPVPEPKGHSDGL